MNNDSQICITFISVAKADLLLTILRNKGYLAYFEDIRSFIVLFFLI